jgi:DNA-directed RNA polymerase specialized sigma24 family protein
MEDSMTMPIWARCRRLAGSLCRVTLARLRAGAGGFYSEDDFWQDLFLEFWSLLGRWRARHGPPPWPGPLEEEFLQEWRGALWGGGRRVTRRAPQRLWALREVPLAPDVLDLGGLDGDGEEPADATLLDAGARAALTQPDEAAAEEERGATLAELEAALWRLDLFQRQELYLRAVAGLAQPEACQALGGPGAEALPLPRRARRRWLFAARRAAR